MGGHVENNLSQLASRFGVIDFALAPPSLSSSSLLSFFHTYALVHPG